MSGFERDELIGQPMRSASSKRIADISAAAAQSLRQQAGALTDAVAAFRT
jgi:hypothetical protein